MKKELRNQFGREASNIKICPRELCNLNDLNRLKDAQINSTKTIFDRNYLFDKNNEQKTSNVIIQ